MYICAITIEYKHQYCATRRQYPTVRVARPNDTNDYSFAVVPMCEIALHI